MQFTLLSPSSATAPFALGFAFRQGDVPSGRYATTSLANSQVSVKNLWPDGSLKFAVIAGRAQLSAGAPTVVTLSTTTTAPSGTALTTANLRATGVTAATSCGAFGSVTWSGADWDAPFVAWVSGPEMSSWIYRKQIGSDAHLVAWLEVRLFADGQVEVLPWIENGYLNVPGATNKSATYTFTLGGTQRFSQAFDLPNHCRAPLVSGAALSHWLGTAPSVTPKHDTAYLMATELVPSYYATVSSNSTLVSDLPSTFTPLQQGSYPGAMGSAGYDRSIGLLPEWDVLYLTSNASTVWAALQRNAYSGGRYAVHHRDETTNRPLRFSSYPTLVANQNNGTNWINIGSSSTGTYTSASSGTTPAAWAATHHPSMGFMAYLVTGRFYHMETTQFVATACYLNASSAPRENASGIFQTWAGITSRQAAWSLRSLVQAAAATPDSDTLRSEFVSSVEANINRQHATYVAQSNNQFGFMQNDVDFSAADNLYVVRTWMHDFYTAAFGYLKALNLSNNATVQTKATEFFRWTAQRVVGRFGGAGATEYLYRDAAIYDFVQNPSDSPNYGNGTGPWYANWGDVYAATLAYNGLTGSRPKEIGDGSLRGTVDATAYWGNLQPALAYAVRHGATGALAAYNRMRGAPNWSALEASANAAPTWGVRPTLIP